MQDKLRRLISNREQLSLVVGLVFAVLCTMWIAGKDSSAPPKTAPVDWTLSVPKGHLVVPIIFANNAALVRMVERAAVVDVFTVGQKTALAENLRIIKLSDEESGGFGALVPDQLAGRLQGLFSRPKLHAAIRTSESGPTRFHLPEHKEALLQEFVTGE